MKMLRSSLPVIAALASSLACSPAARPCADATTQREAPPPPPTASSQRIEQPSADAPARLAWPDQVWPDQETGVVDPAPLNDVLTKACGTYTFDDVFAHLARGGPDRMKIEMEVLQGGEPAIGGAAADEVRLLVERVDLLDDSVGGERSIVTLRHRTAEHPSGCAGWFIENFRMEWRCVRGGLEGKWVHHGCP